MTNSPIPATRRNMLFGLAGASGAALAASGGPALAAALKANTTGTTPANENGTVWWVELVSSDMAKAAKFYATSVGWTANTTAMSDPTRAPRGNEPAYTLFSAQGEEVAGAQTVDTEDTAKRRPLWIVYFQVDNIATAVERAVAAGGTLLIEPYTMSNTAKLAVLADLDGTPFGFATPL